MNEQMLTVWMRRKLARMHLLTRLKAVALAVGSAVGFVASFGLLWLTSSMLCRFAHGVFEPYAPAIAVVAWVAAVLYTFWSAPDEPEGLSLEVGEDNPFPIIIFAPGIGATAGAFVARQIVPVLLAIFSFVIRSGPFLAIGCRRAVQRMRYVAGVDPQACGRVLAVLADTKGRVSFRDIIRTVPGIDYGRVFTEIGSIDGILFLVSDPPGLVMSTDLREELAEEEAKWTG